MRRFPWSLIFLPILIALASQGQGSSSTADYLNRSTASRTNALQGEKDVRELVLGNPIERELAGGQVHNYQLKLSSGQYLYVVVDQRGIDVVVTLFGPDANKLFEVDSPNGTQGPEPVQWLADVSGTYRLDVRALEKSAAPGRYEITIKELRGATAEDHNRLDARKAFVEGQQLSEKENFNSAIAAFSKAIQLDPQNTEAYAERASAKFRKGDDDGAINDYDEAIKIAPKVSDPYIGRGLARFHKDDLDGGIGDFTKAIELNVQSYMAYWFRGLVRQRKGDLNGAITDLTKAIEFAPLDFIGLPEFYNHRGHIRAEKHDLDGALADFSKAIQLNPQLARAYGDRGVIQVLMGNDAQADKDFKKCFALDPKLKSEFEGVTKKIKKENRKADAKEYGRRLNSANEYFDRGLARAKQGDREGAIADFGKAIEMNPRDVEAHINRGSVRDDLGDYQGAIADYTKAIELDAKNAGAYRNRGVAKFRQRDADGAIADLSKAIELDPGYELAYGSRAQARGAKGDFDGAIADFSKVIEIDPRAAGAYFGRAHAWENKGELEKEIADLTKVIEIEPKDAETYGRRGLALLRQGKDAEAEKDLKKCFELDGSLRPNIEAEAKKIRQQRKPN